MQTIINLQKMLIAIMQKILWIYCITSLLFWSNLFWFLYVFVYPNNIPVVPSEQKVIKSLYDKINVLKHKNDIQRRKIN